MNDGFDHAAYIDVNFAECPGLNLLWKIWGTGLPSEVEEVDAKGCISSIRIIVYHFLFEYNGEIFVCQWMLQRGRAVRTR